jgi:predicted GNAT family acetyltransferase
MVRSSVPQESDSYTLLLAIKLALNSMHVLDNVIWQALTSRQTHLAQANAKAARFLSEVSMLAGVSEPDDSAFSDLASLLRGGERVGLFLERVPPTRPELRLVTSADLIQMVYDSGDGKQLAPESQEFLQLGENDVPEMLALTQLTKPGPFNRRTHELGDYFGIRISGKLVAMAGERLRVPGYTEISAICTHPDFLGRGYASALTTMQIVRIRSRAEIPFLHVLPGNRPAVALYERLGFKTRHARKYVILEKR